jgi:hypothetical protein
MAYAMQHRLPEALALTLAALVLATVAGWAVSLPPRSPPPIHPGRGEPERISAVEKIKNSHLPTPVQVNNPPAELLFSL